MSLHLGGCVTPVAADALAQRLAAGPVWLWVAGADGGLAPFLDTDDAVEVTSDRSLPLVIVAGRDGLLRPIVAAELAGREAIVGGVRRIWRAHLHRAVDRGPWRWLLGHSRVWNVADRIERTLLRVRELRGQFAPPPALATTEAAAGQRPEAVHVLYEGVGLAPEEEALARAHLRANDRLLDIGCGTGREAFGFAALGLVVTGVDVCAPAIAVAQREAARRGAGAPTFRCVALGDLPHEPGSYDAVYLSCAVYQWIPGRAERIAQLGRFRDLVGPGGLIIVAIDVAAESSRLGRLGIDLPRRVAVRLGRTELGEPGDRWSRELGPGASVPRRSFRHRFFSGAEVRAEVAAAGLIEVEQHGRFWVLRVPGTRAAAAPPRRYRRRADVVAEANQDALVLVQLTGGVVFSLNSTGRTIWDLAGAGASVAEIAERLHRATGVPLEQGRRDASTLLDELTRRGLIDVAGAADGAAQPHASPDMTRS